MNRTRNYCIDEIRQSSYGKILFVFFSDMESGFKGKWLERTITTSSELRLGTVGLVANMFKVLYMHEKGNVIETHIPTITHRLCIKRKV